MKSEHLLSKFQEVIWREALHCDDEAYAYQLLALLPDDYENRTPQSVFRNRPKLFELENALYGIHKISGLPLAQALWTPVGAGGAYLADGGGIGGFGNGAGGK